MDPRQPHDYRITTNNNDEGLQPSYPGPDHSGFSNLSQLLELAQPIHTQSIQHNATSVSPSSTYYGSASPATIFSPPVKTPMDNATTTTANYHTQNPTEAAFPLFAPAPNPHHHHQTHPNPNVHPGPGVTRFPEFKLPNFNHPNPADFFHYPPPQPQPPLPQMAIGTAPNAGIVPAPLPQQVVPPTASAPSSSQEDITINKLTAICPPQDAEDLRDRHANFSFDISLQQLHLQLMWKWYTERERPSNDDLLKFHRAIRRQPGHTATKGTGSRGGAEGYTCLWPGCTKQDQPSRSDRAQEHALLHLGLKPFGCKACGAEFTRHNELKRHDKTCKNKKAHIHTHNLSADDITLPFIIRDPVPSSSRRTSFPSTPSSSTRPHAGAAASKKARRAIRGVSSDPSSGGNSPTSPLNSSSSSSRPHLPLFSPLTVDSHEQSHHTFFDSNNNNTNTTTTNPDGGNPGFNGAQFQPSPYQYPFAISPHGAPLPLPLPGTTTLSPTGYGPNSAPTTTTTTTASSPRTSYVPMSLPYPYVSTQPQPQQRRFGHPTRSPFSFPHPLHNVNDPSDPFSSSSLGQP